MHPALRHHLARGTVTLAGLLLGAFIGLVLAPILPPIAKAQAATNPVGSTAGAFDVSDSGAATYSIPIAVPPGVRGMQPGLALTYNSQNRDNGLLGIGWSLSGLSVIHRCGATIAIDGFKGGVNYDANDRFCLDGERLIWASDGYYHTERETWQRVSYAGSATNPDYFVVQSPDGGTRIYGGTGDSRIEAQGQANARIWALNRVQDKRGNALTVTYAEDNGNGDYRPTEISYVGGTVKVTFGYENRTDVMPRYEAGSLVRVTQRLTTITTTTDATSYNPANAKRYELAYDNGAQVGKSRLKSVAECGFDGTTRVCLSPTAFGWQQDVNPSSFVTNGSPPGLEGWPFWEGRGQIITGDFNADGRGDIANIQPDGHNWVALSNSNGTFATNGAPGGLAGWGFWEGRGQIITGDFNGDGTTDIADIQPDGNHWVALSNGNGSFTANGSPAGLEGWPFWEGRGQIITGDFNGDGKTDIADIQPDGNQWVALSNGNGTFSTNGAPPGLEGWPFWEGRGQIRADDFNGDGKTDIVNIQPDGNQWVASASGPTADLMTAITNGQGAQTTISYKPLTDSSVYTKYANAVYPVKDVQNATCVVSSHSQSNGIGGTNTWNYAYAALKYDQHATRSYGYNSMDATEPDGILQRTYFYQTRELAGQIGSSYTYMSGVERKRQTFARDFVALGSGRVLPRLAQTTSSGSDLNGAYFGSTTTTYSNFDGYGFPGTATTTTSDNYTKTVTNTYDHDTVNWMLGRIAQTSVTATAPGQPAQTRTSSFAYVPTYGELQSETLEPYSTDQAIKLTTTYSYDVFGNKFTTTVTGWDGSATVSRSATTAFDATGRFLVRSTNALGHNAYVDTYDTRFGAPTYARDVNNIATSAVYDGFGRKTSETRLAGTSAPVTTWISYSLWTDWYGGKGTLVVTTPQGGGVTNAYNDMLGRPLQVQTPNLYASNWSMKTTTYDALGRLAQSAVHLNTETPRYTTYAYDALSRPKQVTPPLDTKGQRCTKTTNYSGLSVTNYNCANRSTGIQTYVTTVKNTLGAVLSTTDNAGTVTNTYDAVGNLLSVRDPVGNTSSMGYDMRGRKTSMSDPDMGAWLYTYNAFGELRTQRDAKLQTITMTYDVLGRMKTRVNPEGTSTWYYDNCTKGIGKLCSVTGFGVSEYQYYDALGRPYQNWSYVGGTWYALTTGYDAYSRPLTLQYPTGFRTRNVYDAYGHLCEVWSDSLSSTPAPATCGTTPPASGNERFWQANTQSAQGLTQETYGNGMVTDYTYDPASGDLTRILTRDSEAYTERDITLDFDAPGNLMSRSWWDGAATRTESFTYDALNRLTQVGGPAAKSASYNAIGNILTKSDVGTYTYPATGSARPHAVASIAGALNTSFTYDANGNQLTGNGRTNTWTSFNKVKTSTRLATTATFSYGPNYERRVKVSGPDTTHYVGKLYERTTSGSFTGHQHYIHAGSSLIGVYRTRSAGDPFMSYYFADHLGSIDTVTGESGGVAARFSFDAWGRSRNPDGTDNASASTDYKGFTRHEHDEDVGLINMNAREYDPQIRSLTGGCRVRGLTATCMSRTTRCRSRIRPGMGGGSGSASTCGSGRRSIGRSMRNRRLSVPTLPRASSPADTSAP